MNMNGISVVQPLINLSKKQFHRSICADPLLHGAVLNLYLNGEEYPKRVLDYFPYYAAENLELAQKIYAHMEDEDKHVRLYTKVLKDISQPVVTLPIEDCFNHAIRSHTSDSFTIDRKRDSSDTKKLKLAHFLAHAHVLEKRITRSLEYHLEACLASNAKPIICKVVQAVLDDEYRHVGYTLEAVKDLLPTLLANKVLASHQQSERTANVDFSARQLNRLRHDYKETFSASSQILNKVYYTILSIGKHSV
jgi:hypothetical protein